MPDATCEKPAVLVELLGWQVSYQKPGFDWLITVGVSQSVTRSEALLIAIPPDLAGRVQIVDCVPMIKDHRHA